MQLDVSPPRVVVDLDPEVGGYRVQVLDPQIGQSTGLRVASVLGQVQPKVLPGDDHVRREAWFEPMFRNLPETQPGVPAHRCLRVANAEDRRYRLPHSRTSSALPPQ